MSKADSLRTAPATGLNRRHVLTAGAAVAAASAVPVLAAAAALPSPELLRWRVARPRFLAANAALTRVYDDLVAERLGGRFANYDAALAASLCGHAEAAAFFDAPEKGQRERAAEAALDAAEKELDEACDAIRARPVRSWQDVVELAEMFRGEYGPHDLTASGDDDLEVADLKLVLAAVAAMAGEGGSHV